MIGDKKLKARIAFLEAENASLRENQLKVNQAKELYLKIFEDFPALIWRAGLDKLCNHFNRTWLEFTGRSMEQEVGNGWTEGVHPDDFDFCLKTYVEAFDKREAFLMEYRILNKNGEYRWLRDFGRPFFDLDDSFLGYIGSCYDITNSKNLEIKLQDLNSSLSKLVSILAHDLRSPISTMIGISELLHEGEGTNDKEWLSTMHKNIHQVSKHTLAYLDELLVWGQAISNGIVLHKQPFVCEPVCKEVMNEFTERASLKGIQLSIDVDSSHELNADLHMFKTILRNLISNALKFTNTSGEIKIGVEKTASNVLITVQDSGIGMNTKQINALWLSPVNASTIGTQQEKGGGFGLTICKTLMEKHEGTIEISSLPKVGTTFTLKFPN